LLVLNNITFEFGSRALYKDTSWHIKTNEKIGLIGANGTGKSTLLRVITGEYSISGGQITRRRDLTLGFLNQDLLSYQSDFSILHVAMEAFERQNELNDKIEALLKKLEHEHGDKLLNDLHDLQNEFDVLDGYNIKHKAETVLEGLGFKTDDLHRPLKEFSGGWRMRVMLAKILLKKPSLLLLDEPTNHLDLPSIEWLEQYLADYDGTIVIVSHDRYFLDKVVNRIVEIDQQKLTIYSGNYSFFLEEKQLRRDMQKSQFTNQQKYIDEQEKLINRFRAKASKAKMAQSRIKMLEKLDRVEDVEDSNATIHVNFAISVQPGKTIATLDVKGKQYGDQVIMKDTNCQVLRGDKIALIGANGRGKSTLLRMINGSEKFEGTLTPGHNVITSFYAQHQLESLNIENEMMEELQQFASEETDGYLRKLLGAFLFKGDDVFKKIKILSGGEKARVALAKTILAKANFLLLDEPTNHLDMRTVNTLIDVLDEYEGTFVVVSHDRYFLAQVANKIWYIENHEIKEYPGNYDEYETWRLEQAAVKSKPVITTPEIKKENKVTQQADAEAKEQKKQKQKLEQLIKKLDGELTTLKNEKQNIETQMAEPDIYKDVNKLKLLQSKLNQCQNELNQKEKQWETTYAELIDMN
jgi:ATP-binding cassette, subfamily F, member 3